VIRAAVHPPQLIDWVLGMFDASSQFSVRVYLFVYRQTVNF
jgi:hypothetical protein